MLDAVAIHVQPRATKDLDILVKADTENAKAVFGSLAEFGAPLQGLTPGDFEEPGPFFRIGREPVGVDILTAIPGVGFDAAWARPRVARARRTPADPMFGTWKINLENRNSATPRRGRDA